MPAQRQTAKRYRQKRRRKIAQEKRLWAHNNPKKIRAMDQRKKERHPEQAKAHTAVRNAVYQGRLQKPTACERCHQPTLKARLQGHHHDYAKPLEVEWLCHACHQQAHAPRNETRGEDAPKGRTVRLAE
jgi:hypothetical protein